MSTSSHWRTRQFAASEHMRYMLESSGMVIKINLKQPRNFYVYERKLFSVVISGAIYCDYCIH